MSSWIPTHAWRGVPVREITADEYFTRTGEPRIELSESILCFEHLPAPGDTEGMPDMCIATDNPNLSVLSPAGRREGARIASRLQTIDFSHH